MVGTVPCTIITSRIRGSSRTRITTGIEIIPAKAQLPLRHHEVTAVLPGHPLQPAYKAKANHLPALHEDHTAHQAHRNRIVHRPGRHTVVLRIAGPLIAALHARTVVLREVTAAHQDTNGMKKGKPYFNPLKDVVSRCKINPLWPAIKYRYYFRGMVIFSSRPITKSTVSTYDKLTGEDLEVMKIKMKEQGIIMPHIPVKVMAGK